jgi:dipeptidyl aminopeptidase/acylaminoacyl peptidase
MLSVLLTLTLVSPPARGQAQQPYSPQMVPAEEYARAEGFMGRAMNPLVFGTGVRANWLDDGRFWYRVAIPAGAEFIMVDPRQGSRERAFDHERLARGLAIATGESFDPFSLPFNSFEIIPERVTEVIPDGTRIRVEVDGIDYWCSLRDYSCGRLSVTPSDVDRARTNARRRGSFQVLSPDGSKAAFIRDHNLWMRNVETGAETQLTTDGMEDFGYATNNAGWTKSDRPVLLWSPDSKKIATFQHDGRGVGMMYLVSTRVGHPELEAWKYPLPEDSVIFRIHRVVIHTDGPQAPRVVRLDMPPDQHRSTICDHIYCNGAFADVEWAPDGSQLAFVSSSRDHKEAKLRVADPESGEVRDVLEERVETFFESGEDMINWHFFPEYDEVIWFSERTDWGHLYLYDLQTGQLKHPITSGEWRVLQLRHIDREARMLYFTGSGKEPGDPYFQYLYSVSMDGGEVRLLTPDSANHSISFSPDYRFFVDAASTPLDPGTTVLRDMTGREVVHLETGDISQLVAAGWQPPIPFKAKARDGITDVYGIMFQPSRLDPNFKYPIVNYLYPGPQSGSVGSRSFSAARRSHQAMAELGFVVVTLDAMGTPGRTKSFHEAYYGNMGDNGLPDQIAAIRQLAERNPWMDLDRVGIWGGSGGGFASTAGILRYPDFYKVAVSTSGNHDNRNYEDDWGEKWQGLLEEYDDGTTNYDNQANQLVAGNLKGKLLLAHGTMDSNVPPYNTLVVVDALIAANKDFDLLLLPNRGHGLGESYMQRRRWDYFVEHLLGAEPPEEYTFGGR